MAEGSTVQERGRRILQAARALARSGYRDRRVGDGASEAAGGEERVVGAARGLVAVAARGLAGSA